MKKKFEVSEQNFTEDRAFHHLCSVMPYAMCKIEFHD